MTAAEPALPLSRLFRFLLSAWPLSILITRIAGAGGYAISNMLGLNILLYKSLNICCGPRT